MPHSPVVIARSEATKRRETGRLRCPLSNGVPSEGPPGPERRDLITNGHRHGARPGGFQCLILPLSLRGAKRRSNPITSGRPPREGPKRARTLPGMATSAGSAGLLAMTGKGTGVACAQARLRLSRLRHLAMTGRAKARQGRSWRRRKRRRRKDQLPLTPAPPLPLRGFLAEDAEEEKSDVRTWFFRGAGLPVAL